MDQPFKIITFIESSFWNWGCVQGHSAVKCKKGSSWFLFCLPLAFLGTLPTFQHIFSAIPHKQHQLDNIWDCGSIIGYSEYCACLSSLSCWIWLRRSQIVSSTLLLSTVSFARSEKTNCSTISSGCIIQHSTCTQMLIQLCCHNLKIFCRLNAAVPELDLQAFPFFLLPELL